MPKRKVAGSPETPKPALVRAAVKTLTISAADFLPRDESLPSLRQAARGCRGCDLWKNATQTVFGEGNPGSTLMMVGEKPGDKEDLAGHPFVGPAGALLDKALDAAGIDRKKVYVTNAVKHFKWMPRGRKRIHKKPSTREIAACRPWLDAELRTVRPRIVVCLGSTAAQALLGKDFKVTQQRGEFIENDGILFTATVHPSSILRSPDDESRHREMDSFIRDLKKVAGMLQERKAA
jgi:uracil-DNA glycosylase family protein